MCQTAIRETAPPRIPWRDLLPLSRRQKIIELTLPLPWLLASWALYASPIWWLGALPSFMFFLCALRLNHEAIHGNLGLPRKGDMALLHLLSAVMFGCNSSIAWSHVQRHRHAMGPNDLEGHCGHMTAGQVLRYGPRFPFDLIRATWARGGQKWQRRIIWDGICVAGASAATLWAAPRFLLLHLAAMATAQCLTAFFAVWITHQGTANSGLAARSQRGVLARRFILLKILSPKARAARTLFGRRHRIISVAEFAVYLAQIPVPITVITLQQIISGHFAAVQTILQRIQEMGLIRHQSTRAGTSARL